NSSKLWDYQTLMNQTKNTWIYYNADSEAAAAITTTTAAPTTTTTTAPFTSTTIAPITGTSVYTTTYVSSASGV
ncbi:MAG: hypothetical protein ILO43_02345, partial [Clostridia bacterium]|nr:hypothetical protein [Clostridia bacterium]